MVTSQRFGLPFLAAGQGQKEITHNEALLALDCVLHPCCANGPSDQAPEVPETGMSYLCGPTPSGDWTGHADALACWTDAGWRFVAPVDGLEVLDRSDGRKWLYFSGKWSGGVVHASEVRVGDVRVVGSRQAAIAEATGGNVVDDQARLAVAQILIALRSHGLIATAE